MTEPKPLSKEDIQTLWKLDYDVSFEPKWWTRAVPEKELRQALQGLIEKSWCQECVKWNPKDICVFEHPQKIVIRYTKLREYLGAVLPDKRRNRCQEEPFIIQSGVLLNTIRKRKKFGIIH